MGQLTTHILDTARGKPGSDIKISLYRLSGERQLVVTAISNADGRTENPLLAEGEFRAGCYEIEFAVGEYFERSDLPRSDPPFLDTVVVRVTLVEDERYHVPLLVSPWSYSTYRGS